MKKSSVLFVCMGNICRSPAAEAVMRSVAKSSQQDIQIESAATEAYHVGERPDARMRKAAAARGFSLDSRGRHVNANDLAAGSYDLVVAMDHANVRRLRSIASTEVSHVRLFSEFLDDGWPEEVPDPYYGGDAGFEQVLDMLEAGCPRLLESLTNNQKEDDA
ncbi:low molecular weight protein-tyrosine-phosphatase [Aporhodopirellula rubra]|uniref:low molecular weight protein-tyrosine-phosphatase n=1 Tax=Aporhodopirellula rubra TaxID=980271 RepID=UPI001FEAA793|nr:low molecular weight protein-tyrosine-phosphatase [Aporhodopirellula rubra]